MAYALLIVVWKKSTFSLIILLVDAVVAPSATLSNILLKEPPINPVSIDVFIYFLI